MPRKLDRPAGRFALAAVGVALSPTALFAHAGAALRPHDLWKSWTFEPFVVFALLAAGGLYALGCARLWKSAGVGSGIRRTHAAAFGAGWIAMAIALVSPLHSLGSVLFSAHMAQHELLIAMGAPLLVIGRPLIAFLWALSPSARRHAGSWSKLSVVQQVWLVVSRPGVAFTAHAVALWVWHLPGPYQATLSSEPMHALQHASFIFTAVLFWWTIVHSTSGDLKRTGAVFYLFVTALQTGALGALLAFAPTLWYPCYASTTAPWGLTPLDDQQLGGLIMWIPGSIPYLIATLLIAARWLRDPGVASRRRDVERAAARTAASLLVVLALVGCDRASGDERRMLVNANVGRGRDAIKKYGCGSCHTIPGISNATAMVGPPLAQIADRVYIAGVLPNNPDNMIRWIENPPGVDSKTAMPNMGVTTRDARDIAAYLYTLR
ncbi:MAG: cytochrome c oxidase assembly protein [Gemmatimonadaceae bacterium]